MTPCRWTIGDILTATGGALLSGAADLDFAGIAIDSRTIAPDQLFVAVAGETHDGHRFVDAVLAGGVRGVMVARDRLGRLPTERMANDGIACVCVADTTRALGELARYNRRRGGVTVVAVTGSNGKTSTRMLTTLVVERRFGTLSTQGNLNNHIGLPLTLLRLSPDHAAAVLELGMNHAGEIAYLGGICEPDVGVITNVGPAHLEYLGSIDNVARAKGELLATIRSGGTAVLNADDPRVAAMAGGLGCQVCFFGSSPRADIRAEAVHLGERGVAFTLITPAGQTPVNLATPARVMVSNALAAAAVGIVMAVPLAQIKAGLEAFVPPSGRMGIRDPGRGICLLDDAYNANPASMAAAIETLAGMAAGRRTIAVLGVMLELGPVSDALHRRVGEIVGRYGIDRLYVTGRFSTAVAEGARAEKMPAARIVCGSRDEITAQLVRQLAANDLVLVKGSRGMAMEHVVAAVCRWAEKP